jgi:hypothetical protein
MKKIVLLSMVMLLTHISIHSAADAQKTVKDAVLRTTKAFRDDLKAALRPKEIADIEALRRQARKEFGFHGVFPSSRPTLKELLNAVCDLRRLLKSDKVAPCFVIQTAGIVMKDDGVFGHLLVTLNGSHKVEKQELVGIAFEKPDGHSVVAHKLGVDSRHYALVLNDQLPIGSGRIAIGRNGVIEYHHTLEPEKMHCLMFPGQYALKMMLNYRENSDDSSDDHDYGQP